MNEQNKKILNESNNEKNTDVRHKAGKIDGINFSLFKKIRIQEKLSRCGWKVMNKFIRKVISYMLLQP
jgi:hypothetical protein